MRYWDEKTSRVNLIFHMNLYGFNKFQQGKALFWTFKTYIWFKLLHSLMHITPITHVETLDNPLPLLVLQHLLITNVCTASIITRSCAALSRTAWLGLMTVAGHTRLVAHWSTHSLPLAQSGVYLSKWRSSGGDLVPTLHHEGIHSTGTVFRTWQQLSWSR